MRKRLTARRRESVENPTIPYPGSVNQPDRKFKTREEYDNYVETLNHPTPDMRSEWQDNPRDGIGFGIPKESTLSVASVRVAANKAVRIAVLLLGEKVSDEVIEAQARDLMSMKGEYMDATLARFAETQELYEAAEAEAKATTMVSEAIAAGDMQAINYFVAQKYVDALKEFATSPNQKTLLLPMETTGILGSLAGITEIAKSVISDKETRSP